MLPLRNVLRRKARSFFAVLQIAVAIAAFVSIVGVTQGLRAQFYRISQVFAFDLIVQARGAASPIFSSFTDEDAEKARAVPGVAAVSLLGFHVMRLPTRTQPVSMLALEPGGELLSRYRIVEGRPLRDGDEACLLIGAIMAQELGLKVGQSLEFEGGKTFEVVGLFEPPVKDVPFLAGQAIFPLSYPAPRERGACAPSGRISGPGPDEHLVAAEHTGGCVKGCGDLTSRLAQSFIPPYDRIRLLYHCVLSAW